jgi:DNA-binding CsgD family transcriptional regulator
LCRHAAGWPGGIPAAGVALPTLRQAWSLWRGLDAPYEAARVRLLIGLACRAMGDLDSGDLGLDAARLTFQSLGATADAERVVRLLGRQPANSAGLTQRELEVLTLTAKRHTNREIATTLVISQHTVGRHVPKIFAKLGVRSRTAVGSYAYEHGLV